VKGPRSYPVLTPALGFPSFSFHLSANLRRSARTERPTLTINGDVKRAKRFGGAVACD
jgi:hypothetical protein